MICSNGSDVGSEFTQDIADFQITFTVSVQNADALWRAALWRHEQISEYLTQDDMVESIGPREDPCVEDCLTTMALSFALDGCSINDIEVQFSEPLVIRHAPAQTMPSAALPTANHCQMIALPSTQPVIRNKAHVAGDHGAGFSASAL